ncbi:MAG: ATP-binding protein [Bryobacteraceae bacterium]
MEIKQQSILNVDDYDPGRYARTKVLRQAGFDVLEAKSGTEALDLVLNSKPSIVLLDVNMPDMSGFEVCRRIRENPATAATTVVHISASSIQTQHQVHGLDSGADSYLVEPIEPEILIATVKAFLRARLAEDALRRSNEDLERFAYMVAHDLNEPLRTVSSYAQLLEKGLMGKLDENSSLHLRFIVDGAGRMRALIQDILHYSQANQNAGDLIPTDMELALQRVTANLQTAIESIGARLTHDPLPVVLADSRIDNVLQNLISNAVKYTRPEVPAEIHVSAKSTATRWVFSVQDNGIGIAPEYQKAVFGVFRRLHGQNIPGTGLGLALCQRIIEDTGGSIWLESKPGSGSTFHFTVAMVPANQN